MEKTKVAIVGMGAVGTGVARLLLDHGDRTGRHAGRTLWLEQVVVRDVKKHRDVDLPAGLLSDDLTRITRDPEIEVVAQLIGGLEPARTIMLKLLESGKRAAFQVKEGDRVLFTSYAGSEVNIDGEEYLIMTEDDILAVVE